MRKIGILLCVLANFAFSQGWLDFEANIGDGYKIVEANHFDISLCDKNGVLIVGPNEFKGIGPVLKYWTTRDQIFLKCSGFYYRNKFPGDSFPIPDETVLYYFIVNKGTNKVIGPISKECFDSTEIVKKYGKQKWQIPASNDFITPYVGTLIFTIISIPHRPLIAIPILLLLLIPIGILISIIWIIIKLIIKRKKRRAALQ